MCVIQPKYGSSIVTMQKLLVQLYWNIATARQRPTASRSLTFRMKAKNSCSSSWPLPHGPEPESTTLHFAQFVSRISKLNHLLWCVIDNNIQ